MQGLRNWLATLIYSWKYEKLRSRDQALRQKCTKRAECCIFQLLYSVLHMLIKKQLGNVYLFTVWNILAGCTILMLSKICLLPPSTTRNTSFLSCQCHIILCQNVVEFVCHWDEVTHAKFISAEKSTLPYSTWKCSVTHLLLDLFCPGICSWHLDSSWLGDMNMRIFSIS